MSNNTLESILQWHRDARPVPTDKDRAVQFGCHLEEVAEMCWAIEGAEELSDKLTVDGHYYKTVYRHLAADHIQLLDALCDQIVTAVGVAHCMGYDILGALAEVSRSNDSKRDSSGEFLRDDNGKIMKAPGYSAPNLKPFVGAKADE